MNGDEIWQIYGKGAGLLYPGKKKSGILRSLGKPNNNIEDKQT